MIPVHGEIYMLGEGAVQSCISKGSRGRVETNPQIILIVAVKYIKDKDKDKEQELL